MRWLIVFFMVLSIPLAAQNGVDFRDLTFEEALNAARQEKKLVFVDCYASWCVPCKYMAEKVFSRKEAGDYFNVRFVCVKYDMEKGEGRKLAELFQVGAYPTFVIIAPNGVVRHKLVGGNEDVREFISRVEKGMGDKTNLAYMNSLYDSGRMDREQLMDYYLTLLEAGEKKKSRMIYEKLWEQLPEEEKVTAKCWPLFEDEACVTGTEMFDFLLAHLPTVRANVGGSVVDVHLENYYEKVLMEQIQGYVGERMPSIDLLEEQIASLEIKGREKLDRLVVLAGMVVRGQSEELAGQIRQSLSDMTPAELKLYASGYRGILWRNKGDVPKRYEKMGGRLIELIIKKMWADKSVMTMGDMEIYLSAISMLGEEVRGKYGKKLVRLGDEVLERGAEAPEAAHVRFVMNKYRKK